MAVPPEVPTSVTVCGPLPGVGKTSEPTAGTAPRSAVSSITWGLSIPALVQVAMNCVEQSPDCGETLITHCPLSPSTSGPHVIWTAQIDTPHGPVTRNVTVCSVRLGLSCDDRI